MSINPGIRAVPFLFLVLLLSAPAPAAQQAKSAATAASGSSLTTEQALTLAQQGHCKESLATLKRAMTAQIPADTKKQAGVMGLRCSMTIDNREATTDFIHLLSRSFPKDPDILFIVVHAYSDLSSRTAQDLARNAPQSLPAHKLNAEAYEMQGNWDAAQHEYEIMIEKDPNAPGTHFLLARVFLSRPDAGPNAPERAKEELKKELQIDPNNAGAHYILGELARRANNCAEATPEFQQAAKLDPTFAEAFLGWGFCLVELKKYEEAIPPLRAAEKLTPGNPAIHFSLGTALARTNQTQEAEKEFAIHRSLTATTPAPPGAEKPQ